MNDFLAEIKSKMTPAQQRYHSRWMKVHRIWQWMRRNLPWMNWPILEPCYTFWYLIIDEGIKSNIASKFDGMQFSYLNDGMKPSLWHTWYQMTHHNNNQAPYLGIYPGGAPKSLAEAESINSSEDIHGKYGIL